MRTNKSALFIKRYCQRAITCSYLQNSILLFVFPNNKINQRFCIAIALILRNCRNVLDFERTISFIRYNTLTFNSIIIKQIQPAFIENIGRSCFPAHLPYVVSKSAADNFDGIKLLDNFSTACKIDYLQTFNEVHEIP